MSSYHDGRFRPTALVVDDDEAIRFMVSRILEREGFQVTPARDGFDAIRKLEVAPFDLILLDLMMPRIDGFGVLHHLRKHAPERLRRVVVMTAMSPHRVDAGVGRIVGKPFDVRDLAEVARQMKAGGEQLENNRAV